MAARGSRIGELAVCFDQFGRRTPPVQTAQQNRRSCFHHDAWRISEDVGKPDVSRILAQPNRVREVRVGMVFNHEMRRAAFASQPRVDALKKSAHRRGQLGVY